MPRGVYDRVTAKKVDRRAVALAAITPEVRVKMSAAAVRRHYERVPCVTAGCARTVTRRASSGKCKSCRTRDWKKAHPERVNEHNRSYNAATPDVMRRSRARWAAAHPDAVADSQAARRARKQGQFVEKVYRSKVLRLAGGLCGVCSEPVDPTDFHVDHIVPLARGGEHSYANCQPAHPNCNLRKAARIDPERSN